MTDNLTDEQKQILSLLENFNKKESIEKIKNFLIKKGLDEIRKSVKELPESARQLLTAIIKDV